TLTMTLVLSLSTPNLALAGNHGGHDEKHGPMPVAVLGSVFGGVFWVVSTPFCLLFAPKHTMDSFDLLVAAPWRRATGQAD
ncbi:hypothetical protein K2X89_05795, partial [Myxococcota bacterium]|nr:hypothetical protein [Myxococcota bacterium]